MKDCMMFTVLWSLVQLVFSFVVISAGEFVLFFGLVKYATDKPMIVLWKTFTKTFLEAAVFAMFAIVLTVLFKVRMNFTESSDYHILLEHAYAWMLFLSLVLTCSMHYPEFGKEKYKYAFFALIAMILFLLLFHY